MKVSCKSSFVAAFLGFCLSPAFQAPAIASPVNSLQCLVDAYPEWLKGYDDHDLIWHDGTRMPLDEAMGGGRSNFLRALEKSGDHEALQRYLDASIFPSNLVERVKDWDRFLDGVSLRDMVATCYPKGKTLWNRQLPRNFDPGRARFEPFFYKMYGSTEGAVENHLARITWLPGKIDARLPVTRVNRIHEALQGVSEDLAKLVERDSKMLPYLQHVAGTFNWRLVAGTPRRSSHSWGMTIDLNEKLSDYWRDHDPDSTGLYKLRNRIPWEIVEIFEKHGFIWGGKWYSYDTMHFEYRPDLLDPRCICN